MSSDECRFLVLDGACPGEGVWSWARSYTELVECVRTAWGRDFTPIFKYKLPCIRTEANTHTRTHLTTTADEAAAVGDGSQTLPPGVQAGLPDPAEDRVVSPSQGRPGTCYVVLNDADDFELWLRGGAYVDTDALLASGAATAPAESADADADGDAAAAAVAVHHHGSAHESADEILHGVAYHMNHAGDADGRGHDSTTAGARHRGPQRLSPVLYAFRAGSGSDGVAPRYGAPDTMPHTRASPPVRRADSDVIEMPTQSLLEPAWLVRLGVSVVLRHSAAPAEVILFSAHTPTGQGELPWGALCLKARLAWGVHAPQFRYVDYSYGVTQMLINHVNDLRAWVRQMRDGNNELLVVEQAVTASRGEAFAPAEVRAAIHRQYAQEWPEERGWGSASTNVVELVRQLKALERDERIAAVARPGREALSPSVSTQAVTDCAVSAATPSPTPPPRDLESVIAGDEVTRPTTTAFPATAPPTYRICTLEAAADTPATETPYRPVLLQPRRTPTAPAHQRALHAASAESHSQPQPTLDSPSAPSASPPGRSSSARHSGSSTPPIRQHSFVSRLQDQVHFQPAPLTATDARIDEELRGSMLDASSYTRLLGMLSPSPPQVAAATITTVIQRGALSSSATPPRTIAAAPQAKLHNTTVAGIAATTSAVRPAAAQPTQERRLSSAPPNVRVRQWVFARSAAAASGNGKEVDSATATTSAPMHTSAPRQPLPHTVDGNTTRRDVARRAEDGPTGGASTALSGPPADVDEDVTSAQSQARRHQKRIAQHFHDHVTLPSNGRVLGATPVW